MLRRRRAMNLGLKSLRLFDLKKRKEVRMKNSKTILLSRFILLVAMVVCGSLSALAAGDEPVCGSLERFNQTHRWQDLPGCTEKRDYSNPRSTVSLLGRA